jgi:hypothetical protein
MDDSWAQRAQMDLSWSFDGEFPTDRAPWYVQAAAKSTNPRAKEYLQERADELAGKRNRSNPPVSSGPMDAQTLATAKSNLFVNLRRPNYAIVDAMERFVKNFGTNKAAAADALIALLPEMQAELPEKKPEVLSGALSMQVTTNVPILAEFRETLAECARDSKRWPKYDYFWTDVHQSVLPWSFDHGCFELAEQIISHETRDMATNAVHLDDRGLLLGLEYYRYEQWEKALKIFETFSNRPVDFHSSVSFFLKGPSRLPSGLVLTERYTIACEKKLGRPHVRDARQFDLEAPVRELSQQGTFFADASGLWTADFGELRHVGFDSKREVRIPLPATNEVAFNCMMVDGENVWLGTAGNGLWRISKTGCEQFTVGDGLLMDSVRRLGRDGDTLWIGYAERQSGGLGAFSLASQHFKSFMPAFNTNAFRPELVIEPPDGPPRHPVEDLAVESSGDVLLLVAEKGLQRYRPGQNSWEMVPSSDGFRITSVAASEQHLARGAAIMQYVAFMEQRHGFGEIAEGASAFKVSQEKLGATKKASPNLRIDLEGMPDEGGVELCSTATGQWRTLRDANGIPSPPMAMVFDGNDLWLGGKGYVACIDAKEVKVKRFCYVPGAVSRLQVAGGWVWAHVDNQLYRGH